ncbi:MAG TPA: hypothetical protein VII71_01870 [Verrucomicrobiae bacterium]
MQAMDRWSALSMLESGDNDKAIGPGGEISRFQIQRVLWPGGDPQDAQVALAAAQELMRSRLEEFEKSYKRPATDFEFYILWNAPRRIQHPTTRVMERARRFANLVKLNNLQPQGTNSPGTTTNAP